MSDRTQNIRDRIVDSLDSLAEELRNQGVQNVRRAKENPDILYIDTPKPCPTCGSEEDSWQTITVTVTE